MSHGAAHSFRRHPALGIDSVIAEHSAHRFPPHAHPELLIGLTVTGRELWQQEGVTGISGPGMVRLIAPGVVHAGGPVRAHAWSYRAIYVPAPLVDLLAGTRNRAAELMFRAPAVVDPPLAATLRLLFAWLERDDPALGGEETLAAAVAGAVDRHAVGFRTRPPRGDHRAVAMVRAIIEARHCERVTLSELSRASGISRFHLIRLFRNATGFTPWQYQLQLRIETARARLRRGEPPSEVALACGFVDQSHFTRAFRAVCGLTPGRFAQSVTPARAGRHR